MLLSVLADRRNYIDLAVVSTSAVSQIKQRCSSSRLRAEHCACIRVKHCAVTSNAIQLRMLACACQCAHVCFNHTCILHCVAALSTIHAMVVLNTGSGTLEYTVYHYCALGVQY